MEASTSSSRSTSSSNGVLSPSLLLQAARAAHLREALHPMESTELATILDRFVREVFRELGRDDSDSTGGKAATSREAAAVYLNYSQALQLARFFGGANADVTVQWRPGRHGPGMYVWLEDHPAETGVRLDPEASPDPRRDTST